MTDEPFPLTDVTVVGTRAVAGAPRGGGGGSGGEVGGTDYDQVGEEPTLPPEAYWTEEEAAAENERQKQCAAIRLELATKKPGSTANWREHFSHTWTSDGETRTHPAVESTGTSQADSRIRLPTLGDFLSARERFGVGSADIVAINHNHPENAYCGEGGLVGDHAIRVNRFPSVADWNYASRLVSEGANEDNLSLYITDCNGETRGFRYTERERFSDDRDHGRPPPEKIEPQDCPPVSE